MEAQIQESWFKRNWKWFVPTVGCGTIIVLFIAFVVWIIFGVTDLLTNSEPAAYAFEQASKNEKIVQLIGKPIEENGIPNGNFNFSGSDSGSIDMRIPVQGPKGNAVMVVVGEKSGGEWTYSELHIVIEDTGEKIELAE